MPSVEKFPKVPGTASISCLLTWLGTKGDYEKLVRQDAGVVGWRRYFSAATKEGRASIVFATYAVTAVTGYLLWKRLSASKRTQLNTKD